MTMTRHSVKLLALLAICLFVSSCAPVVSGTSGRSAVELGSTPIEVVPGQTLYVFRSLELGDVGMTTEMLGTALFVQERPDRFSARATGIGVVSTRVPAFWSVELDEARYVERHSANRSRTTLEVTMRVNVPADAALGQHALRVRVESRRGGTEFTIPLRVRQLLN